MIGQFFWHIFSLQHLSAFYIFVPEKMDTGYLFLELHLEVFSTSKL